MWAALIEYHRPGSLKNKQLFFTVLEDGNLRSECQHGQIPGKGPLPNL